jgi:hypothetical protein
VKAILLGINVLIVSSAGPNAFAQLSIDTTRFAKPIQVAGAIPGLYRWSNSAQSDSADVTILSPIEGQRFKPGDSIFVTVSVSGIAIGAQTQYAELTGIANSVEGQYTGIILDNSPCLANDKSGVPFFAGLATPGTHILRVFASRSWHESVKSPGSLKTVSYLVGDSIPPEFTPENNPLHPGRPFITWNSPNGEYVGKDAKAILLDFFITNATISSESYQVRLSIDGASTVLTEWVPYLVTGLKPGEHTWRLELLSPTGELVGGDFAQATRAIVVK